MVYTVQYTHGKYSSYAHSTLINRLKPSCDDVPWALCSMWFGMPCVM